jgi:hypothetical protein
MGAPGRAADTAPEAGCHRNVSYGDQEKATLTEVPIRLRPCVDESDNLWRRVHRVLHFIDGGAVLFA